MPGGNPDLRPERGFTYDAGCSWTRAGEGWNASAEASWFDSRIDDWILWLPTTKGFYTPRNVRKVHAYGVEFRSSCRFSPWRGVVVDVHGSYSWTPSVNDGEKMTEADRSVGRSCPIYRVTPPMWWVGSAGAGGPWNTSGCTIAGGSRSRATMCR